MQSISAPTGTGPPVSALPSINGEIVVDEPPLRSAHRSSGVIVDSREERKKEDKGSAPGSVTIRMNGESHGGYSSSLTMDRYSLRL